MQKSLTHTMPPRQKKTARISMGGGVSAGGRFWIGQAPPALGASLRAPVKEPEDVKEPVVVEDVKEPVVVEDAKKPNPKKRAFVKDILDEDRCERCGAVLLEGETVLLKTKTYSEYGVLHAEATDELTDTYVCVPCHTRSRQPWCTRGGAVVVTVHPR
jgi:hypothetical protein